MGDILEQALETMIAFGRIISSSLPTFDIETEADLDYDGIDDWGHAAIIYRPASPDSNGSCEVACLNRGDELVPIASRESRWRVDVEEGEVIVRGFGEGAARIHLKADGTATVIASVIELGENAKQAAALGDDVKAFIDAFLQATPTVQDGGAAIQTQVKAKMLGKAIVSDVVKVE